MDQKPHVENRGPALPGIQASFFTWEESASTGVELFPSVWEAAENLSSPELAARRGGLTRLVELNAARYSPLIAYLLVTRITETDIHLRGEIIRAVASIFQKDAQGRPAPQNVRLYARAHLARMRTREVYGLLQASDRESELEGCVAALFNACPLAGRHLCDLLADRQVALPIRRQAARMLRLVGYLDAIPILEQMERRLEARLIGQEAMPFAPQGDRDEGALLPEVRRTLYELQVE